jgi:hypothetical protein
MAGLTLILALNSASLIMPGYWLRELPLFKTMVTITRWRLLTVFFVIIGACRGFDFILDKFAFRRWAYLLVGVSLCGLVYNQFYQWSHEKWPSGEDFLNSIPIRSETILSSSNPAFKPFAASARNIALIRTNETLLGYSNDFPSKRISIENPAYKGEILGLKKQILKENIRWTQNKIFIKSDEENLLFVNQNPGNYWRLDGECLYPDYRAFETDKYFIVKLSPGSHVISASPPELSSVCVVVLALFLITGLYSYLSFAGKKKKSCS